MSDPRTEMIFGTATVTEVERLSPSFVRVELGGEDLADFGIGTDGHAPTYDQRIKLLFGEDRSIIRTYTIREVRRCSPAGPRLVVDFALHPAGPAAEWAAQATVGQTLGIIAPRQGKEFGGIEWAPGDASRYLIVGDETATPAVCAILETLAATGSNATGTAFLEVPTPADFLPVEVPPGIELTWIARAGAPVGERVAAAVGASISAEIAEPAEGAIDPDLWETPAYSSATQELLERQELAPGELYAWIAGEAGMVTGLRRHLVTACGVERRQVAFMGYWRAGRAAY